MAINLKSLQSAQDTLGRRWLLTFDPDLESELQSQIWATKRRTLAVLAFVATALLLVFALNQRSLLLAADASYVTKLRFFVILPLTLALGVVCLQSRPWPTLRMVHLLLLAALGIGIAWMQTSLRAIGIMPPFAIFLLFVAFTYMLTAASLALACAVAICTTAAYAFFAVWLAQAITDDQWAALVFANILGFAAGRVHEKFMRGMFLAERIAVLVSLQDPLTGLANRRAGLDHVERALRHSRREQLPITVMMIDVDFFKLYNDHYGHIAGDDALRRVAAAIHDLARRPLDVVCRYGGEEFLVVLYGLDANVAGRFAERFRIAVERLKIEHARSQFQLVTVSIGICQAESTGQTKPLSLIEEADNALYQAKADGRNRCVQTDLGAVPQMSMFATGSFQVTSKATAK